MKKSVLIFAMLALLVSLLFGAFSCAKPTPTPATPAAPISKEEIPKIHIRMNGPLPKADASNRHMRFLGDLVGKMSDGRITFEYFDGGAMWVGTEGIEALRSGVTEAGGLIIAYFRDTFPVAGDGSSLPFGFDLTMAYDMINMPVIGDIVRNELKTVNIEPVMGTGGTPQFFFKKPLPNGIAPKDMSTTFKGLRLRGSGVYPDIIKLLGGESVFMQTHEYVIAIRQGQLDGVMSAVDTWWSSGLVEDLPVVYRLNLSPFAWVIAFNKTVFDSYPPKVQQIIRDAGKTATKLAAQDAQQTIESTINEVKKNPKVQVIDVTQEEIARWREAIQPIWNSFAAKGKDHQRWVSQVREFQKSGYTPSWERR